MNAGKTNSILRGIPSAALAVFVLVGATIILFGVGESTRRSEGVGYLPYILNYVVILLGCFFIIRANPKSVWSVPLICNVMSIIAAFAEPTFWQTQLWIPNCVGWALTIVVAIAAWRIGKRASSAEERA